MSMSKSLFLPTQVCGRAPPNPHWIGNLPLTSCLDETSAPVETNHDLALIIPLLRRVAHDLTAEHDASFRCLYLGRSFARLVSRNSPSATSLCTV